MLLLLIYEFVLNIENSNLTKELNLSNSILEKYKAENSLLNDKISKITQDIDK